MFHGRRELMASKFNKGDIVQLKSGGPKMTVDTDESDKGIWAVWFAGAKRERAHFSIESLLPVAQAETSGKKF